MNNPSSNPDSRPAFWRGVLGSMLTGIISIALSTLVFESYGLVLFLCTPFIMGAVAPLASGTKKRLTAAQSILAGLTGMALCGIALVLVALEGLLCLAMASPIAAALSITGSMAGIWAQSFLDRKRSRTVLMLLFLLPPSFLNIEPSTGEEWSPEIHPLTTSVQIAAPPEIVWQHVIAFSEMKAPSELLFKAGIAYPIRARIEGHGPGAIRYCDFSTGSFVEPIEIWEQNKLLAFSVRAQPVPMHEISPYEKIDPAHLHGYFVSVKGQFRLRETSDGGTLLEGTTWYYQKLRPEFYWNLWSDYIVHSIHQRVLNHIQEQAEQEQTASKEEEAHAQ